jgi:5-formyltetrahydrofolate cyclo-ligase
MTQPTDKAAWRERVRAARRRLTPGQLSANAQALRSHLGPRLTGARTIAAYAPIGTEPGSLDLLDDLLVQGTTILLPVVVGQTLEWAEYAGRDGLAPGARGMVEPHGRRQGPAAVRGVDAVLIPAHAVDHRGVRLGRGAGHYDRALGAVRNGTPLVALLHDGELVPELPADPWDHRVTVVSAPEAGWTELPFLPHHALSSPPI